MCRWAVDIRCLESQNEIRHDNWIHERPQGQVGRSIQGEDAPHYCRQHKFRCIFKKVLLHSSSCMSFLVMDMMSLSLLSWPSFGRGSSNVYVELPSSLQSPYGCLEVLKIFINCTNYDSFQQNQMTAFDSHHESTNENIHRSGKGDDPRGWARRLTETGRANHRGTMPYARASLRASC
jgi:hypothetical protein